MNPTDDTAPAGATSEPNPNDPPERNAGETDAEYLKRTKDAPRPGGPLGGPVPKTRERLLAEQELASGAEAEREAIDAAKEEIKAEQASGATGNDAGTPLA